MIGPHFKPLEAGGAGGRAILAERAGRRESMKQKERPQGAAPSVGHEQAVVGRLARVR